MGAGRSNRTRLAIAGAIEAAWFLGLSLLLGLARQGYDPIHDAISRLGEQGSSSPLVWNVGGFGVAAFLYALYAIAIADRFGRGAFALTTLLQAVTLAGSAVFSCDLGCPPAPTSTSGALHTVFGLPYFAVTCLAPFVAAWTFRRHDEWRPVVTGSAAIGALLVALFLVGPFLFGAEWIGLWQRLVLVPALVWQAWVSIRLDRSRAPAPSVPGTVAGTSPSG